MIENKPSIYNAQSVYNQGGGGAVDYKPIESDEYKRLAYIRRYNSQQSYISVNFPLKFTDKIRACFVFNSDLNNITGYTELWIGNDAGFRTKLQKVSSTLCVMNKWNYMPGGGTGYDFPITFNQGVFNLFVNKDTSIINGITYPVTTGSPANTDVKYVCRINSGNEVNVDFYNFVIMDDNGKNKYSLYPALRNSDSVLGAYCEENKTFYPATYFDEAGPVIE